VVTVAEPLGAFCETAANGAPAMMLPTSADKNFAVRLPILVSRLRMTQLVTFPFSTKSWVAMSRKSGEDVA
jgi:hypothetical protein